MRIYEKRYSYRKSNALKTIVFEEIGMTFGVHNFSSVYLYELYTLTFNGSLNLVIYSKRINHMQIKVLIYHNQDIEKLRMKLLNHIYIGFYWINHSEFKKLVGRTKPDEVGIFSIDSFKLGSSVDLKYFYLLNKSYYFKEGK